MRGEEKVTLPFGAYYIAEMCSSSIPKPTARIALSNSARETSPSLPEVRASKTAGQGSVRYGEAQHCSEAQPAHVTAGAALLRKAH